MKRFKNSASFTFLLILASVLSACAAIPSGVGGQSPRNDQPQEVVFTGTVEAISASQWTVSGQPIAIVDTAAVDTNIQIGDHVKVEAVVDQAGLVTALRIQSASDDDNSNANSNDDTTNTDNSNDANANNNANANDNANHVSAGPEQEVFGVVQVITTGSITINDVIYQIADFTEFNDLITLGDTVKVHVILNADGTFTIREIEKTTAAGDNDNSNFNGSDDSNANDDNGNDNNSGGNNNGDDDDGNDGGNGNDDDGDDDNDNDSGGNNNG